MINFHSRVAQIFVDLSGYLEKDHFSVKTAVTISWQLLVKIGLHFSLTSGHFSVPIIKVLEKVLVPLLPKLFLHIGRYDINHLIVTRV